MDTYKLVIEVDPVESDDSDHRMFSEYASDTLSRIVSVAHRHGFDLLSLYLIKATNCAPSNSSEKKNAECSC